MKPDAALISVTDVDNVALSKVPVRGWCVVGLIYAVTMTINAKGLWHWGPDTRYYLAMTYRYSGLSEHEAGVQTYEYLGRFAWFKDYCYFACDPHAADASFGHLFHGEAGGMVAGRVLYPLLSVPFVWLFGPQGMLVVPFVAFTVCLLLLMAFVSRTAGPSWSVLAAATLLVPITVSNYAIYAYTESLAMCLVMGCLMVMPLARTAGRREVVVFTVLLLLVAVTRQFHAVVAAGVLLAWLGATVVQRRWRNQWLPFATSALAIVVIAAVIQSLIGPDYSILKSFKDLSGVQTVSQLPAGLFVVSANLVRQEIWDIGHDVPLAVVCAAAAVTVFYRFASPVAWLTLGAVLGTFFLNVLNTEPSHFRYYLTAYPFIAVAAIVTISGQGLGSGGRQSVAPVPTGS